MYWLVIKAIYEEGYIPLIEKQLQALEEFVVRKRVANT